MTTFQLDSEAMMNLLKQDSFPTGAQSAGAFLKDSIKDFFDEALRTRNLAKADVIRDACVDRGYGYQILDGT